MYYYYLCINGTTKSHVIHYKFKLETIVKCLYFMDLKKLQRICSFVFY